MRIAEHGIAESFHCREIGCEGWIIIEDEYVLTFECLLCGKENCVQCKAVHAPASCEEHQRNEQPNEDNDLTEREKKVSPTTCISGNMKIMLQ